MSTIVFAPDDTTRMSCLNFQRKGDWPLKPLRLVIYELND